MSNHIGVLIADNDQFTGVMFENILKKCGNFEVWRTITKEDTLEKLKEKEVQDILHIFVTDLANKEMNGPLLLQSLKNKKEFSFVDILICSQWLKKEEEFLLQELGVVDIIDKEVQGGTFLKKIQTIIKAQSDKRSERELALEFKEMIFSKNKSTIETFIKTKQIEEKYKNSPELIALLAEGYIFLGQMTEASRVLSHFLKNNENKGAETFKILSTYGKVLSLQKKYEDAKKIYERLAEKSPLNFSHETNLGHTLLSLNETKQASEHFQNVLNQNPEDENAKVGMGQVLLAQGQTESALSLLSGLDSSIESESLASYFNNAGISLSKAGKFQEALALFENALPFFNQYQNRIKFNQGMTHLRSGMIKEACEYFQSILQTEKEPWAQEKKILQELKEVGHEAFIAKYSILIPPS